jgi:hypothetical protein
MELTGVQPNSSGAIVAPDFSEADGEQFALLLVTQNPGSRPQAKFTIFHELTPEQYAGYLKALGRIQSAANGGLLVYVEQSQANLENTVSQIRELISKLQPAVASASANAWFVNVACLILTFSSALHLHQEQTLGEVKRAYGDNSRELASAEKSFSGAYDSSFAYRLFYRLRNVLVHHSLGSVGFEISSKEDRSPSGLIINKHIVRAPLKREVFLSAKQGVNATMRHEIESLEADPDLVGLASEAMVALRSVHDNISLLIRPTLYEDARLVCELNALFGDQPGERGLVKLDGWPPSNPMQVPISPLRPELFHYAREIVADSRDSAG